MKTSFVHKGLALILALSLSVLSACGSSAVSTTSDAAESAKASAEAPTSTTTEPAASEGDSAAVDDPYYTLSAEELRAEAAAYTGDVQKLIVIGTASFDQVAYYDENDYLTGFEIETLRAIDELLPEYEFEFTPSSDFAGYFLSVEEGKADIAYCQIEWNEERAQKYLYTNESYCNFPYRIGVLGDDTNDYQTLSDLAGKTVDVITGGNEAYFLEQWNEEHPDEAVNIHYSTGDITIRDADLKNGTIDAYLTVERIQNNNNAAYNLDHKCVGEVLIDTKCYFITNLENTTLRDRLDTAIAALKADGTLRDLSIQFFGGDYTE
jgi:L-cystine transport system substrate-binding protein